MSEKTIQLNPDFMTTSKSKKLKTRNKKSKIKNAKVPSNANSMRKQLLKRIKDYQKTTEEETKQKNIDSTSTNDKLNFSNEFNKSLDFLQKLSSSKKKKTIKKQHKKNNHIPSTTDKSIAEITIQTDLPNDMQDAPQISIPTSNHTRKYISNDPPYSCLKNGSKPLYREWKRNTQRKPIVEVLSKENMVSTTHDNLSEREKNLIKIKEQYQKHTTTSDVVNTHQHQSKDIEHRIKKKSFLLGRNKTNKQISVLVKNKDTRKRIKSEHGMLKQKSIIEVKNYLRQKNLLKTGSDAPHDVLRTIYENAILSGEIKNKAKDTLVHNFYNK